LTLTVSMGVGISVEVKEIDKNSRDPESKEQKVKMIVIGESHSDNGSNGTNESTATATATATAIPVTTPTDPSKWHPQVIVSQSRAYPSLFTKLRDINTSSEDFVKYAKRLMRILVEDALGELSNTSDSPIDVIQTPCGSYSGIQPIDPKDICLVSIVRSGDALLESAREILPGASVGKILIQRDESSPNKAPTLFYSKLPKTKKKHYILCDPMLATGGSALLAIDVMKVKHQIPSSSVIFCNVVCAPEGLQAMAKEFPKVKIVTASIDSHLNQEKFIVPGLGDYGDRFFNTTEE